MSELTQDEAQEWLRQYLASNQWAQPTSSGAILIPSKLGDDAPDWRLVSHAVNVLVAKGEIMAEAVPVMGQDEPSHFKGVKFTNSGFLAMQD